MHKRFGHLVSLGRAIVWGLVGQVIGIVVSALGLSGPSTFLWATVVTVVTCIVGSA